ncbi:MAG: hypothetical protein Q3976_01475 [Corynebacterium sp.]|nr:hypothetical protein [Corynebacterium sp.]
MKLQIDESNLLACTKQLAALTIEMHAVRKGALISHLTGAYSAIPQLQALAGAHAVALVGGSGSARSVLDSYHRQLYWAVQAMRSTVNSLLGQNAFVARGLDIADEGGLPGGDAVIFPPRPATNYGAFPFMVVPKALNLTLEQMAAAFAVTDDTAVASAVSSWASLAKNIATVAGQLETLTADIATHNHGAPISAAMKRIHEIARHGEIFSGNAAAMATYVGQIETIKTTHHPMVTAALAQAQTIMEPEARVAFEAAEVAALNASLTAAMPAAIPPFRELMTFHESIGTLGSTAVLGMDAIAKQQKSKARQYAGMVGQVVNNEAGSVATLSQAQDAVARTYVRSIDDVATSAASVSSPADAAQLAAARSGHVASPAGMGGSSSGMPGNYMNLSQAGASSPMRPSGMAALSGMTSGGTSGITGTNPANSRVSGVNGGGTYGSLGKSGVSGAQAMRAGMLGSSIHSAGLGGGARTRGTSFGATQLGGYKNSGSQIHLRGLPVVSGSKSILTPPIAGTAAGSPGGVGAAGGGTSAGSGNAAMTGRGAMMMSPANSKEEKGASKVRSVITEVERDANLKALVGRKEPVVPDTIGAWAREPAAAS